MEPLALLPALVAFSAAALASVTDIRSFRVPNWLSLPLLVSGGLYHGLTDGWAALLGSVLGMLFGGGILLLLHLRGGVGGGDVKLMAGVGAWLGVPGTVHAFIAMGLAAGLYALVLLLLAGGTRRIGSVLRPLADAERVERQVKQPGHRRLVPLAPMIALGVLAALVWSCLRPGP
jgi:prepilin peptidase CpaA